jgi:Lamin Tail Domain/CotH kinase protein/Bacterial TSP3 repeat
MKLYKWNCLWVILVGSVLPSIRGQNILINEIMYHPSSENVLEEYIELYNSESTNVNVGGWQITSAVKFKFPPDTIITAGGYYVVAADLATFAGKYPGVDNVAGGWEGTLSNSRNNIQLEDGAGHTVDSVQYADEGDWAQREEGPLDLNHRGWTWYKEHDGLGKSLELINRSLPNQYGLNWASSLVNQGTPGLANSVASANIAPLILNVTHAPIVPKSTDLIHVLARILDEQTNNLTVRLHWRIDASIPPAFTVQNMFDDGLHADGAAGDGIYGLVLGAFPNGSVVEFYVEAQDGQGNSRTWPGPARLSAGGTAQSANALLQVDDENYTGAAPLYRLIMTAAEYQEMGQIFSGAPNSDAQMNATFISLDGAGTELRYLCGIRNRGHGSRVGTPHNYRINIPSDQPWKGRTSMNINARNVHSQHLGAALAQKAGVAGANSRAVQLRVNAGPGPGGTPPYGHYAANEVIDSEWAGSHYPFDSGGDAYKVVRDIRPPEFDYRGENPDLYRNTYFKSTNVSEDDWTGLINMLRVMGLNGTIEFDETSVRQVVDVEQWMRHLALMCLFANGESGIYTGNNDDYYLYGGVKNPRYLLVYHDLDSLMGISSLSANTDIFRPTCCPISGDSDGIWRALNRFMHWPAFEPIYYATLQQMLDTTFSKEQFDPMVDQVLGDYVPSGTISGIKSWMDSRRSYVQSVITGHVPPAEGFATVSGEPRSPTWISSVTLNVGGAGIVTYRYRLNEGIYGPETPVSNGIQVRDLAQGSTNTVYVLGKTAAGVWQSENTPTVSQTWVINTNTSPVRLNEILARNETAVNHSGTFPDLIELFNEYPLAVDLSGMRLTDDPANPDKFVFPSGTTLGPRQYLVLYANNPDGTPGIHLGFAIDQGGESILLYDAVAKGGALLDSVEFGNQLPDLSLGRVNYVGEWRLCAPTAGAANTPATTGGTANLKINEWLAADQSPFNDDFIEIYNPGSLPVDLGGLFLTDQPIGAPALHKIHTGTFIPANGYLALTADGNGSQPGHVGFRLSSDQGQIALMDVFHNQIDYVRYGPQTAGVSMGRCPNGGADVAAQTLPTPGSGNACPESVVPPDLVNIIPLDHSWKYEASSTDLGTTWKNPGFDDSGWPSGPTLIGFERPGDPLAEPIRTTLTLVNERITSYYRTSFDMPQNPSVAGLQIYHIIDDGAVFYVNGTEVGRYNMPGGAVDFGTIATHITDAILIGPIAVPLELLQPTGNVLAVELHQDGTASADQLFGLRLDAVIVTNSAAGVRINEVLADNATIPDGEGRTSDWVELYNPTDTTVSLADASLSDTTDNPRRFVFPPGSFILPGGYLSLRFDPNLPVTSTNTGFGLKASGDSVYLYESPSGGGGILDYVHFGLQVPDFSIGRFPNGGASWNLTLPTLGTVNLAAPLASLNQLKLNEWMADPASGNDWFEIYNPGAHPVAIGSCFLTDDLVDVFKSRVPDLSFIGANTNAWQKFVADGNVGAGADHVNFSLKGTGEALGLYSNTGEQIDAAAFGPQQTDVSQGRLPDGAATLVDFPGTSSPGESNYLPLSNVVVNEVLTHTDLPLEDAIELYNLSGNSVDVGGWWLSDSKSYLKKYQIPAGKILAPHGYDVVYEERFNNGDMAAIPFALSSAKGDEVILSAANVGVLTGYRQSVKFGPAANGVSFGRFLTSVGVDFVAMSERTFGADSPGTVEEFRTGTGRTNSYPLVGPIVISEIMYHPLPLGGTNDNVRDEFVELHNLSGNSVPLYDPAFPDNTWRLRKGVDYDFPTGATIPAGGYVLVVSFDPVQDAASLAAFQAVYGSNSALYGPYSGKLDNGGESIELRRPDAPQTIPGPDFGLVPYIVVEAIDFKDGPPWPAGGDGDGQSLQRMSPTQYGNDPINWMVAAPSPGPGPEEPMDRDGDGMPDAWETDHGLNPDFNDAAEDTDGDGLTNLQEYQAGTDPQDPNSLLRVVMDQASGGQVTLRFGAAAGKTYSVLYRDSLASGGWLKLSNVPPPVVTQEVTVHDSMPGGNGQRFYRLVTPSVP